MRPPIRYLLSVAKYVTSRKLTSSTTYIFTSAFGARGQIDSVDFQSFLDDDFTQILNYQNCTTKFVVLKAAFDVAVELLETFLFLGAQKGHKATMVECLPTK